MDHATIAYGLAWVGTGAWVVCFWWMHRISARQDALLAELRELAQTQQDILREVHPYRCLRPRGEPPLTRMKRSVPACGGHAPAAVHAESFQNH